MSDEEVTIEDPAALLKAHNKLKEEIIEVRANFKALEKERNEMKDALDGMSDETVKKFKDKAIRAEIKSMLEADGVPNPDGVMKYLNLEGIEFDEEDNLTGVDDKITALREDLPILFDKKARASRKDVDIHADKPANTQKSTTEAQVDALFGR